MIIKGQSGKLYIRAIAIAAHMHTRSWYHKKCAKVKFEKNKN